RLTRGEVFAVYNARTHSVRSCQINSWRDAAVDHGNSHTRSIPTILPCEVRIDRRRREVQKAPVLAVWRYIFDIRIGFQRRKNTGGHSRANSLNRVERLFDLAVRSELLQLILSGWSLKLNDHTHRAARIRWR